MKQFLMSNIDFKSLPGNNVFTAKCTKKKKFQICHFDLMNI